MGQEQFDARSGNSSQPALEQDLIAQYALGAQYYNGGHGGRAPLEKSGPVHLAQQLVGSYSLDSSDQVQPGQINDHKFGVFADALPCAHRLHRTRCTHAALGRSLTGKKSVLEPVFPKKPAGTPCAQPRLVAVGGWQLATGGWWWLAAVGGW
jgi:hypothetical protein